MPIQVEPEPVVVWPCWAIARLVLYLGGNDSHLDPLTLYGEAKPIAVVDVW